VKRSTILASALAMTASGWLATAAFAHDAAHYVAGVPGDPKKKSRVIVVKMNEGDGKMMFVPDRLEIKRGEQIKFLLENIGELDHEFVLADEKENIKHAEEMMKNPDMEHDDPNSKRVKPKQKDEIVWRFTKRGKFEYGCLIPGHREAGMIGTIVVK
jgi:uncharacterized cupredoxin-like copper-binding protein